MIFKTNLELLSFIKEITGKIYSIAINDDNRIISLLNKRKSEVIFNYTSSMDEEEQIIYKISDTLFVCVENTSLHSYVKIMYDINKINEFNFFIASLKKLKPNG